MNNENIEEILKKLGTEDAPAEIQELAEQSSEKFDEKLKPSRQHVLWSNIMSSRITKLAAAAVIIIAVVLSINFLDRLTPSVYALEQTMKAYEGLRFVHIKEFKKGECEPQEFWVKYDAKEVKQFRIHSPQWAARHEGPLTAIWENGKIEILGKDERGNQIITIRQRKGLGEEILRMVQEADPKNKVQELHQLETEGKVKIETKKPISDSEPVIITATFSSDSKDAGQMTLYVDQNTRMISRLIINKTEERDGNQHSWEFSDYNVAVDEDFFTFKDIPENVPRYDLTWQKYDEDARYVLNEIGLVRGQLEVNEIAAELVRKFVHALIDKDYEKAGKLLADTPAHNAAKLQQFTAFQTFKKLLCIEQPFRNTNSSAMAITVPCVVVISYHGMVPVVQVNICVEPYPADPNRWVVLDCSDTSNKRLVMRTDPTDATSTFMKNINTNLARLDINKCTAADVIAVLGEPWAYVFHGKDLEKNNLPEAYTMDYPGGFIVNIYKNHVVLWGVQQILGYKVQGYLFADSIRTGMTLDEVFKKLGQPAKTVEGFDDGRNGSKQVMYEDNTIYANMKSNERKGFCFYRVDNNGEKIRIYYDDDVLYKNMNGTKGLCFYGNVTGGKRFRMIFMDDKVDSLLEYRTEPINL